MSTQLAILKEVAKEHRSMKRRMLKTDRLMQALEAQTRAASASSLSSFAANDLWEELKGRLSLPHKWDAGHYTESLEYIDALLKQN